MKFLQKPIIYLEDNDFDSEGNIANQQLKTNKPVFIFIQANFCGYCTQAKPDFQTLAEKYQNKYIFATIQGDSELEETKKIMKKLDKIYPNFMGFPSYIIYHNGRRIIYEEGRDFDSMETFLNKLY